MVNDDSGIKTTMLPGSTVRRFKPVEKIAISPLNNEKVLHPMSRTAKIVTLHIAGQARKPVLTYFGIKSPSDEFHRDPGCRATRSVNDQGHR